MELKETWRRTVLFSGNFHFMENFNWRCFEQPAPELLICWQLIISFSWFRFRSVSSSMIRISNDRCCLWGQCLNAVTCAAVWLCPLTLWPLYLGICATGTPSASWQQLWTSTVTLWHFVWSCIHRILLSNSLTVSYRPNVVPVKEFNPACKSFFVCVEG